jgi:hypothetical protein
MADLRCKTTASVNVLQKLFKDEGIAADDEDLPNTRSRSRTERPVTRWARQRSTASHAAGPKRNDITNASSAEV